MKVLKMKSVNDKPTASTAIGSKPDDVWMLDIESRKKTLDAVCNQVVKEFVEYHISLIRTRTQIQRALEYKTTKAS